MKTTGVCSRMAAVTRLRPMRFCSDLNGSARCCVAVGICIPRKDFSVEDERFGDVRKCFGELGEAVRHVVAAAGEERDTAGLRRIAAVQLAADAVELVLHVSFDEQVRGRRLGCRVLPFLALHTSGAGLCAAFALLLGTNFFGESRYRFWDRIDRAGQHEAERMEEPHARLIQPIRSGQADDFAEVAEQHHGAAHRSQIALHGDRDCLLHLRLLYADAHVAEHQLDQVLCFERRRAPEQIAQQRLPRRGALCSRRVGKSSPLHRRWSGLRFPRRLSSRADRRRPRPCRRGAGRLRASRHRLLWLAPPPPATGWRRRR